MKILLASDHGGFKLKGYLKRYLETLGVFEIIDVGPGALYPDDDYPDYAIPLAKQLQTDIKNQRGIVICRNGVGVCMATNKFRGIRGALAFDPEQARKSRSDDDSNVLCLPADYLDERKALEIVNVWLGTLFTYETRHLRRLTKVNRLGTGYASESIVPCIFEESLNDIRDKIKIAQNYSDIIQVDIADGKLVDGRTYLDMYEIGKIKTSAKIELHLMLENPLIALNAPIPNVVKVCSQIEAENINEFIKKSKELNYLVGLSVDINTKLEAINPYLDRVDYIQFMTVKAGGKNRPFEKKILRDLSKFKSSNTQLTLQVDGHINTDTIRECAVAGADIFAVNSGFFVGNPDENINNLLGKIKDA